MQPGRSSSSDARFLGFAFACAALVMLAALLSRAFSRGSPGRLALALVEGAATGAVIIGSMLRIRRLDELQQRIQLEALAIAFAGTGVIGTAYGFLTNAGMPAIRWGGFDWGALIWPAMVMLWAIGMAIASRRYR